MSWLIAIVLLISGGSILVLRKVRTEMNQGGSTDHEMIGTEAIVKGPVEKSRLGRFAIFFVVIVAFLAVGVGLSCLHFQGDSPVAQTWSQWGMTITHPTTKYTYLWGLYDTQATSTSGIATWTWNNNNTALSLLWFNTTSYNYTNLFDGAGSRLLADASNVSIADSGTFMAGGRIWEYQTWTCYSKSTQNLVFTTIAYTFSRDEQRVYGLEVDDATSLNTLNTIMTYANAFSA